MTYKIGMRAFDNLKDACDFGKRCDFDTVYIYDENGEFARTYEIKIWIRQEIDNVQ